MVHNYSNEIWQILVCPDCRGQLEQTTDGVHCLACGFSYKYTASGALDLRLAKNKNVQLGFELAKNPLPDSGVNYDPLSMNPRPEVDFSDVKGPSNVSRKEMSY